MNSKHYLDFMGKKKYSLEYKKSKVRYVDNPFFIKPTITMTSVAALSIGLLIGAAQAAEWGQSGKGGDGGYSMTTKKEGKKGQTVIDGKGGDGGLGGSGAQPAGKGGDIGATLANGKDAKSYLGKPGQNPETCKDKACELGGTSGGGGGGAGAVAMKKTVETSGSITGGSGGLGGDVMFRGGTGGGGAGGAGVLASDGSFTNRGVITGGMGGRGGVIGNFSDPNKDCTYTTCYTAKGGNGGAGFFALSNQILLNIGTITGGNGGIFGGITPMAPLDAKTAILGSGDGGNGVELGDNNIIVNTGTIRGGTGGPAATPPTIGTLSAPAGADGIGVYAKGDNNTVINKKGGVISAGGANPASGTAIRFEGDNNTFEKQNGSTIIGNVEATGTNNGLSLGGDEDQNFDVSELGTKYKGFDRFQKDGKATAIVIGVSTYDGETVVNEGALKLSQNGNLESSSGVHNNAHFDITKIDNDSTKIKALTGDKDDAVVFLGGKELIITSGSGSYAGTIDGDEKSKFTVAGGHETLTGDNSGYKGSTTVKEGAELTINKDLGGTTTIEQNGLLNGMGSVESLANSGTLIIGTADGFSTKTIRGDYIGNDGTIVFNTVLGDDSSLTDHLRVMGNTSGSSSVKVNKRDGMGAQTDKGIELISVGGKSEGTFSLIGDYQLEGQNVIEAGAYAYGLKKGGNGGNENDYYLTSQLRKPAPPQPCEVTGTCPPTPPKPDTYGASVPLMSAYTQALRTFNTATTLQDRIGNRYWTGESARQISQGDGPGLRDTIPSPDDNSTLTDYGLFWSKISGRHDRFEPGGSSIAYNSSVNTWAFTAGVDNQLYESDSGRLVGGVWFEYGRIDARISSDDRNGKIKANGYGGGASLTWYGDNGLYIDGLGKLDWYRNDIDSDKSGGISIVNGAKAFGYALSLETGKRFELNENWSLTPQAQLSWSSLDMDDFRNSFGSTDSFERQSDLTARLGLTANYANSWQGDDGFAQRTSFYAGASLYQALVEAKSNVSISVADRPGELSALIDPGSIGKTWVGVGAGGNYSWHENKYSIFGNVNVASSTRDMGDNYSVSGNVGISVKW